ncbi:hypothetical protein [Schleiferia thermophila]|uniref:Outer membrane beta-barrel porin/alpha-amylase n=1 Tax=Schleiferia thermophila TaxID=884107 RepID=A0A369A7I9_9FLAO|nr:hypothetical protein [Schleiferia thermophila]RCX05249.1 hypothetical protein DES35_101534 [Schleiferia thermophila]GCD79241.1 hypothetical protein JCM30197_04880 [Schleiferia thermophila]
MRRFLYYRALFVLVVIMWVFGASACDICGCGIGGGYLGVMPQFHKNLIGYRYLMSAFLHPETPYNATNGDQLQRDVYHRQDVWMRYYHGADNQFFVFIPYRMNVREYESGRVDWIKGIGDIQLNYLRQIINQSADPGRLWRHSWFVGAGLQMPTGKFMQRDAQGRMHPLQIQSGIGAWGYQIQNLYILRWKNFGIQSDIQYRYFQPNELEYQLGNAFVSSISLFHWWQMTPRTALLPIMGMQLEAYGYDTEYRIKKPDTGGQFGFLTAGVDLYYRDFVFQVFGQFPTIEATTYVQPEAGARVGLGVAIFW